MDKNGERLEAASKQKNGGFNLDLVDLHTSTEDLQLKLYCSLVGQCGTNTVDLLREAGYNNEADWLQSKNFAVGAAGFIGGVWDRGVDNAVGMISMGGGVTVWGMPGHISQIVQDAKDVSNNGYWATVGGKWDSFSKSVNAYMEESAAAAYYLTGGRNNWSFTDLEGAARFSGGLTVDVGSLVVGPEALLAKNGAQLAKAEAALARERLLAKELQDASGSGAGPTNPLLADSIPRNGDRLVVNQGPVPTCGHNSCGMVLDTLGKEVDIGALIAKTPPSSGGIFATDVAALMRSEGVPSSVFGNRTVADLARYTEQGKPVVVQIIDTSQKPALSHFVVVDGVTERQGIKVVAVRDPHGKQYFSPVDTFIKNFSGIVVVPK